MDTDVVNEAHGLIGDLLLNEAFPDHTKHKLARVKELLAPKVNRQIYTSRMIIGKRLSGGGYMTYMYAHVHVDVGRVGR